MKSAEIKKIVVEYVKKHFDDYFDVQDYDLDDEYEARRWKDVNADATNPKKWKRTAKMKAKKAVEDGWLQLADWESTIPKNWASYRIDEFDPQEMVDILRNKSINPSCICRHFYNETVDTTLDPIVVTDSTDSYVIAIFWHSD